MKRQDFSFISLAALLTLGIATHWPLHARIAVILNSLLVLWQVGLRVWRICCGG